MVIVSCELFRLLSDGVNHNGGHIVEGLTVDAVKVVVCGVPCGVEGACCGIFILDNVGAGYAGSIDVEVVVDNGTANAVNKAVAEVELGRTAPHVVNYAASIAM
jgi:hypothetical protein